MKKKEKNANTNVHNVQEVYVPSIITGDDAWVFLKKGKDGNQHGYNKREPSRR